MALHHRQGRTHVPEYSLSSINPHLQCPRLQQNPAFCCKIRIRGMEHALNGMSLSHLFFLDILQKLHVKVEMLQKGFKEIGILRDVGSIFYHKLNPTSIGHYLGMDIHDCSMVSFDCPLKPVRQCQLLFFFIFKTGIWKVC